jgi:hypothetical protein
MPAHRSASDVLEDHQAMALIAFILFFGTALGALPFQAVLAVTITTALLLGRRHPRRRHRHTPVRRGSAGLT